MVGERRNGNLVVQLGPNLQAYPEELIRQRRTHDGQTEYLIRWSVLAVDEGGGTGSGGAEGTGGSGGGSTSSDNKSENILMWMTREDVYANCPTLLGNRKSDAQRAVKEEQPSSDFPSGVTFDEAEISDMKEDVKQLVRRARRQMARSNEVDIAVSISHTIHVLSAYASIGSLVSVFKETGALDLLMELLCNKERQTRRSAGKMLRALASHDAVSQMFFYKPPGGLYSLPYLAESVREDTGTLSRAEWWEVLFFIKKLEPKQQQEVNNIIRQNLDDQMSEIDDATLIQLSVPVEVAQKLLKYLTQHSQAASLSDLQNSLPYLAESVREDTGTLSRAEWWEVLFFIKKLEPKQQQEVNNIIRQNLDDQNTQYYISSPAPLLVREYGDEGSSSFLGSPVSVSKKPKKEEIVSDSASSASAKPESELPKDDELKFPEDLEEKMKEKLLKMLVEMLITESKEKVVSALRLVHALMLKYEWRVMFATEGGVKAILTCMQEHSSCAQVQQASLALTASLSDLQSSHVYINHYLRKGGLEQERLTGILNSMEYGDEGSSFFLGSLVSLSKKPKKEIVSDSASSASAKPDSELPKDDELKFPEDLEEKMKVFSNPKIQGKKNYLDKFGEVIDIMKKNSSDVGQQLAGLKFITKILEEDGTQEKIMLRTDSAQTIREKLLKMLVEMLITESKEKVVSALRLVHALMLKYEWRVMFATEGGVKAILTCMQEHSSCAQVQQASLAALKVVTGASKHDIRSFTSCFPLSESGAQMMLEIFASIGSATPEGSKGLLNAIPAAIDLMLNTQGCSLAVCNGLLVIIMMVSNHKSLAEQLVACDVCLVLNRCIGKKSSSAASPEQKLAIIALSHISMVHKLPTGLDSEEELDFKDMELKMLLVSLKEMTATKEIILTLERLICDEVPRLELELSDIMKDKETYQALVRALDHHRVDKAVQLSVLSLTTFYCLHIVSLELLLNILIAVKACSFMYFLCFHKVVQLFIRFLHQLATTNKDYAVVMCRLGTKEALIKALDKHNTNLLLVTELRDLISDCEKYASLYKKMTTSILAGCIQMVLGQIEEHRRSRQQINIPFFDVFLRNLCQGSSVELKEDKCWEKVEVSSNHHRANKLTDKNPKTYWESNGSTGSHFINIYMYKGVIIRQLAVLVASEDSSYMPARIIVMGGEDPSNISTELNTVNVPPSANRIVLLENMTRYWHIVQIRIKRCQQGGIDTRIHGFEVLGPKPTFWPVFKEQLCCRTYLFHTTKAHTWCQEILEDKMQLLQLFNKFNSALRHEQMFADRFLPDPEAAEALGRTCWEALITPIVQSVTVSDNITVSPLSWLLNEYLENSETAKRCKGRPVVFNSRVRRLTHLLVHVDTSLLDTEELKPPVKSNGKNKEGTSALSAARPKVKKASSIAGIAQCWQWVVQQQVKKFLDSACSLADFVERYRNMYLRLKTTMEELFGQQTAFVLALRHGFSAALLQLSILTAMHVSERFAQHIDLMIQESGADCGNMEKLNQLQQFMEPMLFLSGLELSNTFEHFYRYYLGDRLLGQGKVWLERAVIEQIGTCFPNRFPQQMLKNLSESEDLQQEFHLYRLQQLDKTLQHLDEEMMEDQSSCPEDESEVKVLVLSPRCWIISSLCYLENPSKHFPSPLCSYLGEFSEFYTNSQYMYSLTHTKPRRLQWTWLGHAELKYGSFTLYVSTLQMYILLQFNQQNEVTMESLLQSTGLSSALLCQALKPLTADKGVLIKVGSTQDPMKGVLSLNEETLIRGNKEQSYCCLLPKQTYLNVDEDAASTLERKRNFIYCLIIQIMKAEKELHIDNLVFRVIDICQKQESRKSPLLVRFSCSNTDVLSCIMHLLNKGYVRRNEDSPHILEFVPEDPTTPQKGQAHLTFTKHDMKKSNLRNKENVSPFSLDGFSPALRSSEDGVLEAVFFSMGRTMTQDEVRQLMNQTVGQVAETLSISNDQAKHLLVHCKWNVDLLIQRYAEDSDSLLLASGMQGKALQPPPSLVINCPVCLSQQPGEHDVTPTLSCMHYCCRSCWKEYLTTRIEQNLVLNCTCPISDCPAQPTTEFIASIITDKEVIAKYENTLLRGYVECCSNLTWCTNQQGCDQILCKEGIGSGGMCSKCCWSSCFSCNFPEAHYPASCSHMSQWMDDGGYYEGMSMEAQSKHLAKLISKRCPSCQAQIEKNEGCLHMTCAKCNHGFCWRCLKSWKPTHKDYYNCSAMVSKAARQEKKFQDYNERCTFQNQAKDFAINLENKVSAINEALQMKSLTFVIDACKILAHSRKVLAYSCVYSYYNQDTEKMDIMEQQTETLELQTNALQILLEETLLQCTDLALCIRLLKPEHLNTGLELIRRIQERLVAILQHSTQDFRVGYQSKTGADQEVAQSSNIPNQPNSNKE
ncbi:UNVERIFIED_CONTAM: hypothetical protein FKN15_049544 [Acipenser sinensis]